MTTGLTFEDFVHDLNAVSKLNWETDNLCLETNFLDLTISINKNLTISTKTYQKPMNLHLYIPPHSAHPPGMVKSLVYGLLKTYWAQNSDVKDFQRMVHLQNTRLLQRGHQPATLTPLFKECGLHIDTMDRNRIERLNHSLLLPSRTENNGQRLFFHIPYHPRDILRKLICDVYEECCETKDINGECFHSGIHNKHRHLFWIDQLTVAYSRPKNLRDLISPTTLKIPTNGPSIDSILQSLRN